MEKEGRSSRLLPLCLVISFCSPNPEGRGLLENCGRPAALTKRFAGRENLRAQSLDVGQEGRGGSEGGRDRPFRALYPERQFCSWTPRRSPGDVQGLRKGGEGGV